MAVVGYIAMLAAAAWALVTAADRLIGRVTDVLDERLMGIAVLAASSATFTAMVLGLVRLGSNPVALTATALGQWAIVLTRVSPPDRSTWDLLARWSLRQTRAARALVGALVGAVGAWTIWELHRPLIGGDGLRYHLAAVALWVRSGTPGSASQRVLSFPVEAYPQSTEVLMTWACAIARSPVGWHPVMVGSLALAAIGVRSSARSLGAPPAISTFAAAVVVSLPLAADQLAGPLTDLPALGWLATTAALTLAVVRGRSSLVGVVILSAALAVGAKSTVAVLAVGLAAAALYASRGELRRLRTSLVAASGVGLVIGGFWYLRNLVLYGSPLWPFVQLPFGDDVPSLFHDINGTFLLNARRTLHGHLGRYAEALAGGLALLAGLFVVLVSAGQRRLRVAAAIGVLSLLVWMNAPFTGDKGRAYWNTVVVGTTRYLLPTLAVAAVVLALACGAGRRTRIVGFVALGAALELNLWQLLSPGAPARPSAVILLVGAGAGAALFAGPRSLRSLVQPRVGVAVFVLGAAALAAAAPGYMERHAQTDTFETNALDYLLDDAAYTSSSRPVAFLPAVAASFAGDTFEHRIVFLDPEASCPIVWQAVADGWVIIGGQFPPDTLADRFTADECLRKFTPVFEAPNVRIYSAFR